MIAFIGVEWISSKEICLLTPCHELINNRTAVSAVRQPLEISANWNVDIDSTPDAIITGLDNATVLSLVLIVEHQVQMKMEIEIEVTIHSISHMCITREYQMVCNEVELIRSFQV